MNKFPDRMKELRLELNLTQTQVAKELGTTQTNLSKWEKGTRQPNIETLIIIAKYFKVSLDYLIGLED